MRRERQPADEPSGRSDGGAGERSDGRDAERPAATPSVGLVVVSPQPCAGRAAVALAGEMLHGRAVPIEVAAGLDETTFGTDAVSISKRSSGPTVRPGSSC